MGSGEGERCVIMKVTKLRKVKDQIYDSLFSAKKCEEKIYLSLWVFSNSQDEWCWETSDVS